MDIRTWPLLHVLLCWPHQPRVVKVVALLRCLLKGMLMLALRSCCMVRLKEMLMLGCCMVLRLMRYQVGLLLLLARVLVEVNVIASRSVLTVKAQVQGSSCPYTCCMILLHSPVLLWALF
jgi:hypothetical protein